MLNVANDKNNKSNKGSSVIIRAHQNHLDVGGVNRYKYYVRPITSSKMYKPSANDTYEGGSIDKYSPRKSNTVLPQIIANGLLCPHNSKGNNYQNTPNGKVSPTLLNPLKSPQIASGSATKSPPYPLPQIPSETNNGPLHLSRFEHTKQQQNTGSNILSNKFHGKRNSSVGQKQLQLIPKDSKNSIYTSNITLDNSSKSNKAESFSTIVIRNGAILRPIIQNQAKYNKSTQLAGTAKQISNAELTKSTKHRKSQISMSSGNKIRRPKSHKTVEIAIQTDQTDVQYLSSPVMIASGNDRMENNQQNEPQPEAKMNGQLPLNTNFASQQQAQTSAPTIMRAVRATQTAKNAIDRICKNETSQKELEQRTELMEIIDRALDETIDKTSRVRTNELIASAARNQAQIWRDAKEFVATVLLPCSIDLANQATVSPGDRPYRHPLLSIGSIQLP